MGEETECYELDSIKIIQKVILKTNLSQKKNIHSWKAVEGLDVDEISSSRSYIDFQVSTSGFGI